MKRIALLLLLLALTLAGMSPVYAVSPNGNNLSTWTASTNYFFDPGNEIVATAQQTHITIAAGNGYVGGNYLVISVSNNYNTGAQGTHNLVQLVLISTNTAYTPSASLTGGTWAYGDVAPASGPPAVTAPALSATGQSSTSILLNWSPGTGGTPSYTYSVYRSLSSAVAPASGAPAGTLIYTGTARTFTDTPPAPTSPLGLIYYRLVSTDSGSPALIGYSNQAAAALLSALAPLQVLWVGNSRYAGYQGSAVTNGQFCFPNITTGGTYTAVPSPRFNTTGTGSGAAGYAVMDSTGTHVSYVAMTNDGIGYTGTLTISFVNAAGDTTTVPASGAAAIVGGAPYLVQKALAAKYGQGRFTCLNMGLPGSTSAQWAPGATAYWTAALQGAQSPAITPVIMFRQGVNDTKVGAQITKATYKSSVLACATDAVTRGYIFVINDDFFENSPGNFDETSIALLEQYSQANDEIVASFASTNPGKVVRGDKLASALFANTPAFFADLLHPNDAGYQADAVLQMPFVERALGLIAASAAPASAYRGQIRRGR